MITNINSMRIDLTMDFKVTKNGKVILEKRYVKTAPGITYWEWRFTINETTIKKAQKGDLIIAMTDVTPDKKLIGRMAIVDKNDTFLLNQRVGLLKLKEVINNKFLCEYGNFDIWRKYSKNVAALGAQANISTKDIKNGKIPLPPIEEQKNR